MSGFDQNRLAQAASFPKSFHSEDGYVTKVVFDADGVWVDVTLYDGRDTPLERIALGTMYAGSGWGMYFPVEVDDRVKVLVPDSGPGSGCMIVGVSWSKADKPPADVAAHPRDPIIVVKENASIRIVTLGTGNIILDPRGAGKVLLGGETGTVPVALAPSTEARLTALESHKHYVPASGGITSAPVTTTPEYDAQVGATTTDAPNPIHGAPGHVHYTAPGPEPVVNSSAAAGGSAVAATKVNGK